MKRINYAIFFIILLISAAPAYWPTTVEQQLEVSVDPIWDSDFKERTIPMTNGRTFMIWNFKQATYRRIKYQIVDGYGEFQFSEDQYLLDTTYNYYACETISDGAGGAVVLFYNIPEDSGAFVAIQRIDSLGNKVWGDTGRIVAWYPELTTYTRAYDLIREPVTGCYFVLFVNPNNNLNSDLYCQKLDSEGFPIWIENGLMVADSFSITFRDYHNYMAPDLNGGVFVVWKTDVPYVGDHHFMQHLDSEGNITMGNITWGYDLGAVGYSFPEILSDGNGGAVICTDGLVKHIDYDNNFTWEFEIPGPQSQVFFHSGDTDDFYITWHTSLTQGYMKALRANFNGNFLWPAPVQLCNYECQCGDAPYGAFYKDGYLFISFASGHRLDVISQKVDSTGNLIWGTTGIWTAHHQEWLNTERATCTDQAGGLITLFHSSYSSVSLYAKRVRSDGTLGGGGMATIDELTITVDGNDVMLNWLPRIGASSYNIYESLDPYSFPVVPTAAVVDTFYVDDNAINEGTKFYRVSWEVE